MNRRNFLGLMGLGCCSTFVSFPFCGSLAEEHSSTLYNFNYQAALGLGDERASILNYAGELRSRHALARWVFSGSESLHPSQGLGEGYLPIVESRWNTHLGSALTRVYTSSWNGYGGDFLETLTAPVPAEMQIFFPSTRPLYLEKSRLLSGNDVLVEGLPLKGVSLYLSGRQKGNTAFRAIPPLKPFLNYGLEHHFAAKAGNRYFVYWATAPSRPVTWGTWWFRWQVDDNIGILQASNETREHPILRRTDVIAQGDTVSIRCDPDPSVMAATDHWLEHAVWMFDHEVDESALIRGELDEAALAHIGWDAAQPSVLRISSQALIEEDSRMIFLPYALKKEKPLTSPKTSLVSVVKERWHDVLSNGAVFSTNDAKVDNLYRTSLINILLLRTRYRGAEEHGGDIYAVKPGCGVYDLFYYRDGAYMVTALDRAGLATEAEKSLSIFWQQSTKPPLNGWVQKPNGAWDSIGKEWDGQGEAPWALVHHFRITGDIDYLRRVYPSLRRGAEWIRNGTLSTRDEAKSHSTHYGLIPPGYDEGVALGLIYSFYLQRWALFGMQEIVAAARVLGETQDLAWMQPTCDEFHANLLASEEHAFKTTGGKEFLPGSPKHAAVDTWGIYNAVYPTGHLSPEDPMVVKTLARTFAQSKENMYTHYENCTQNCTQGQKSLWLYMSIELAFCFLLQDRRDLFQRIFNSYVAHVSPVNAWCEGEWLESRIGSGDIPHGWAAAELVHAVRNSFVLENGTNLELAWGAQPRWLQSGREILAQNAPTLFGVVELKLRAEGNTLYVTYTRKLRHGQVEPQRTRLHLPQLEKPLQHAVINGRHLPLTARQSFIELSRSEG